MTPRAALLFLAALAAGCAAPAARPEPGGGAPVFARVADPESIGAVRDLFRRRNPGYDLEYRGGLKSLDESLRARILFVQEGESSVRIGRGSEALAVSEGDAILLRPGETLAFVPPVGALVFTVPEPIPATVPKVIRPDFDPRLTDTPGGCATETDAYRRLLLTWREENGPYVYRGLNAHRVRIVDSFTHFHPVSGGFDEFYLVQGLLPGGRLLTSGAVDRIRAPETVTREETASLLEEMPLAVGDLVYLPRGVVHRGVGGALVQVITVPGFVPGAEIGVDADLSAINARLGLSGPDALPFNPAAAAGTPGGSR